MTREEKIRAVDEVFDNYKRLYGNGQNSKEEIKMEDYKKKYEDALERAKHYTLYSTNRSETAEPIKSAVESIFPELKESEDELMRKEAIAIIKQYNIICDREGDKCYTADRVIAWLEKQGERVWNTYEKDKITNLKTFIARCKGFNKENMQKAFDMIDSLKPQPKQELAIEQLAAFAVHLQKRGAYRDDLCMDFEHEAQSFIELQKTKEL